MMTLPLDLLEHYGLARHRTLLEDAVLPAIYIHLDAHLDRAQMDATAQSRIESRIGGFPDLPASLSWPRDPLLNRPLLFVLQLNLAELPPSAALGSSGMLYVFMDENEDSAEQILFCAGDEPLRRRELAPDTTFVTDWYTDLRAHTLRFRLGPDLPRWATEDHEELCERLELEDELGDFTRALEGDAVGKLLGYVAGIGHDPRQDAYVVREVNPEWLYDYEQRHQLAMQPARNWVNLLQLDSSNAVNLLFGDAGYMQVLIHRDDLAKRDFSRVYVNLESS